MQGGRDPFFGGFGDPFGSFGGFGGFGGQRSVMSSFFGGRDPFDDPFFTRPFGSMLDSSSFFGPNGGPFMNPHISGFLQHQPAQPNTPRGPVIEELNPDSDYEIDEEKDGNERKENPRKHGRSGKEPFVEDPDDEATEKKIKRKAQQNEICQMYSSSSQPQKRSFTFQSSTMSYGGANGAYYTSSMTKRSGSDGLTFEEIKEADSLTRQATHRVSRGIHEKGHSVTRKLKADGHVDTRQTLYNLNEDELTGFEDAWRGNARKHLPGLGPDVSGTGTRSTSQHRLNRGGWALSSAERSSNPARSLKQDIGDMEGAPQHSVKAKTNVTDGRPLRFRSNEGGSSTRANRC